MNWKEEGERGKGLCAMPSCDKMEWENSDVSKMAATHTTNHVPGTHNHYTLHLQLISSWPALDLLQANLYGSQLIWSEQKPIETGPYDVFIAVIRYTHKKYDQQKSSGTICHLNYAQWEFWDLMCMETTFTTPFHHYKPGRLTKDWMDPYIWVWGCHILTLWDFRTYKVLG